jgi:hypothetical protein
MDTNTDRLEGNSNDLRPPAVEKGKGAGEMLEA